MAKLKDGSRIYGNVTIDAAASIATVNATTINVTSVVLTNGVNLVTLAQSGGSTSNDAYAQANTARGTANDAYGQANTARDTANGSYSQANTARTTANDASAEIVVADQQLALETRTHRLCIGHGLFLKFVD